MSINNATNSLVVNSSSYINNPNFDNSFGLDSISSIIAILGFLGVVAILFHSIKERSLLNSENRNILYVFLSCIIIAILFISIIIISFLQGKLASIKIFEIVGLGIVFIITIVIAFYFKIAFEGIEENYQNRKKLIEFLEVHDSSSIISQPLDNLTRLIIANNDMLSFFVFFLICLFPIFGFSVGLNLLSIIFVELMIFLNFNGFCRLIELCQNDSNITLKTQLVSTEFSLWSRFLFNVFFLKSDDANYFTILTKKGYITILKEEISFIHDNEIIVFKGKEKLLKMNIWVKRLVQAFPLIISRNCYFLFILLWIDLGCCSIQSDEHTKLFK